MSARFAICRVLCHVTNTTTSIFSPLQSSRCLQRSWTQWRLLCSPSRNLLPNVANNDPASLQRHTVPELSLPCLLDMGFTQTQAEQICEFACKTSGGSATKHCLSTLTILFMLGLNPSSVMKVLTKCPILYTIKESLLQERISNLRKLGLVEGSLQRVVVHYPAILTLPVKKIKHMTLFLREKCLFTVQQVTQILRDSPAIMHEDLAQLEYKFQYVYFRMGIKQAEMVKHRLFRSTLEELRTRHTFLERRGLYQTPDKKGQTVIANPKLDSILNVDLDTFLLAHAANASAEEYDVFRRLVAREWKQEERHHGDCQAEMEDSDDDEEEEEEEDEMEGKESYRKRKKNKVVTHE